MAEALYRKYRPQVFEDVVGQEPIERTLKNAIEQDKVSHAYLFTGPRGTGKTTTARLLAKALLCERGPTANPDGTCEDCNLIAEGTHPDVYELDAASRTGVENVREEIISRVQFAPTRGRFKVYIIDEVHMLSTAAFNALLKTLEEPPTHVVFILCTTDPQKVPETIHSRCQRFDFRRIAPESMVSRLGAICMAEDVEFEGEALDLIAHRAEGGLRNALTSLEQIIAFENGKVTLAGAERLLGAIDTNDMAEIMAYIGKRDIANCFRWTANYVETGADLAQFVRDMAEHVRNLYVMALVGDDIGLDISETARRELAGELQWYGADRLSRLLGVLGDLSAELKTSSNPRLSFEIALTRMVRPDSDLTLESLAERVEALESGYSSVAHVLPGEPFTPGAASAPDAYGAYGEIDFGGRSSTARNETAHARAQGGAQPAQAQGQPQMKPLPQQRAQSYAPAQAQAHAAASQPDRISQQTSGAYGEPSAQAQPDADSVQAYQAPAHETPQARYAANVARVVGAANIVAASASDAIDDTASANAPGAPASQAAAAAQSAAQGSSAQSALQNPAALQRIWQAALSAVKKQKQAYGVLFMNTKASYDETSQMLKVVFPAESTFAFNAVQKPDVQEALAAALAKALGSPVPFFYAQGETTAHGFSPAVEAATNNQPARNGAAPTSTQPAASPSAATTERVMASTANSAPQTYAAPTPASMPESRGNAEPTPTQTATPRNDVTAKPASYDNAPYDEVPYEQVSYEQVPYEQVPYDEMPYDEAPYDPVPYEQFDAATTASPAEPRTTPEGAPVEDTDALQAMLQAGFGGGVIFSDVDD